MLKGAVFDFDGTLFDSMSVWNNIGELYLRSKGCTPEAALSETLRTMSLYRSSCYMKAEYGLKESADEISNEINRMMEHAYRDSIEPKAGAEDFLEQLKKKGVSMCIATATDRSLIEAALQRCGMRSYFDAILTCSDFSTSKDEPKIFREALRSLGTRKSETIVFEDACHAVQTAKKDGFPVAGVYDPYESRPAEVRRQSDVYLVNYTDTDDFWNFASAL